MRPLPAIRRGAFTLVEVVLSLGVTTFSLVCLLGLFPVGLRSSARSIFETRGTHLAYAAFTEMRAGPFEATRCFGMRLNLAVMDEATPLHLEATVSPTGQLTLSPPGAGPEPAALRVEARFKKITSATGATLGNRVMLRITPLREAQGQPLEFQTFVAKL